MDIANEALVQPEYILIARVQALAAPDIFSAHHGRVVPQQLLAERNRGQHKPIRGIVVAIIVRQVIINFPENVLRYAAQMRFDTVVGLSQQVAEIVEVEKFREHSMAQPVTFDEGVQFLKDVHLEFRYVCEGQWRLSYQQV